MSLSQSSSVPIYVDLKGTNREIIVIKTITKYAVTIK